MDVVPWLPNDPDRFAEAVVNCLALCLRVNGLDADLAHQIVDSAHKGCGCELGFDAPKTSTFNIYPDERLARGLAVVHYEPCRRHRRELGSVARFSALYPVEVPMEQYLFVLTFGHRS